MISQGLEEIKQKSLMSAFSISVPPWKRNEEQVNG